MLSNTKGLSSHSRVQGYHKNVQSKQAALCPKLKSKGYCPSFEKEKQIREQLAQQKEAELKKKARAMYTLQMEFLADMEALQTAAGSATDEAVDAETEKIRQLFLGKTDANGRPTKAAAAEVMEKLVKELKLEPEYVHWNLEADVAERMVQLQIRPCRYSHRTETLRALKRARDTDQHEERTLAQQERRERAQDPQGSAPSAQNTSGAAPSSSSSGGQGDARAMLRKRQLEAFDAERARVFGSFTPLQRCVAALMWQQRVLLPQHILSPNVRRTVEAEVEEEMRAQAAAAAAAVTSGSAAGARDEESIEAAIEAYLDSPEFEKRVKAAENALTERSVFLPALGVLDLSSLPTFVAYLSNVYAGTTRRDGTSSPPFAAATLAYFGTTAEELFRVARSATSEKRKAVVLTEKELDLSSAPRAVELVEAVEWTIHLFNSERRLRGSTFGGDAPETGKAAYTRLSFRTGRVVLRSLSMRHCQLTLADGLVASLHKSGLGTHLLALDLSDNRLHSLRFLFALRANFAERLLRLSLKNNLITRKPEYQEQVRKSLPRLTSLDGEPIRRPPLRFPKCHGASYTTTSALVSQCAAPFSSPSALKEASPHQVTLAEHELVMDTVARLLYIWEARRIPLTELEIKAIVRETRRSGHSSDSDGDRDQRRGRTETNATEEGQGPDEAEDVNALLPMEEEINEDNFPHRYLHPNATVSFTATPGTTFFDPDTMKLNREVEFDDAFTGMRLNAFDMKEARVFDVSLRNSSRNLLAGRPALQRVGRGCDNCYLAYQYSLYPERLEVNHNLSGATVSITKIPLSAAATGSTAGFGTGAVAGSKGKGKKSATREDRSLYVVELHGIMTWRLPSMRFTESFHAAYDRTLVLTEKMLAAQNYAWERRRSPKLVLCNDQLVLRPVLPAEEQPLADTAGASTATASARPVFVPATASRLARLVVQFGLEACKDAEAFVTAVMERTTSDAAEEAALEALVYGPRPQRDAETAAGQETESDPIEQSADDAVRGIFARYLAGPSAATSAEAPQGPVYHIFSLLDRTTTAEGTAAPGTARTTKEWGGSTLHAVPLPLLLDVTRAMNRCYALEAFASRK